MGANQAPGDCRHYRDLVLFTDLGLEPGPKPHVLVVQIDIDELPELALVVEQPALEPRVAGVEGLDGRTEVGRFDLHGDLAI